MADIVKWENGKKVFVKTLSVGQQQENLYREYFVGSIKAGERAIRVSPTCVRIVEDNDWIKTISLTIEPTLLEKGLNFLKQIDDEDFFATRLISLLRHCYFRIERVKETLVICSECGNLVVKHSEIKKREDGDFFFVCPEIKEEIPFGFSLPLKEEIADLHYKLLQQLQEIASGNGTRVWQLLQDPKMLLGEI